MTGWTCAGPTELSDRPTSRLVFLLNYRLRFETSSDWRLRSVFTLESRGKKCQKFVSLTANIS